MAKLLLHSGTWHGHNICGDALFTPTAKPPKLKIAMIRTSSIGDVVLASACIDLLDRLPVTYELTWFGREPSLALIANSFEAVTTFDVQKDEEQIQAQIYGGHFNFHFIVDLQTNLRSQALARRLAKPAKIKVFSCKKSSLERSALVFRSRLRGRDQKLPAAVRQTDRWQFQMMVDTLRRGLRYQLPAEYNDLIANTAARPRLAVTALPSLMSWQQELKFGRWLAIAPGAAHATKRAPLTVFTAALEAVRQALLQAGQTEKDLGLLFLGAEQDTVAVRSIIDQVGWQGSVLNLSGRLTIWESTLAVSNVAVVLCNDSSIAHIAEAVGSSAAILFGPTVEAFGFAPWRPESRSFSINLGCRPCSKHGKRPCRYQDQLCFRKLPVGSIADHLLSRYSWPADAAP